MDAEEKFAIDNLYVLDRLKTECLFVGDNNTFEFHFGGVIGAGIPSADHCTKILNNLAKNDIISVSWITIDRRCVISTTKTKIDKEIQRWNPNSTQEIKPNTTPWDTFHELTNRVFTFQLFDKTYNIGFDLIEPNSKYTFFKQITDQKGATVKVDTLTQPDKLNPKQLRATITQINRESLAQIPLYITSVKNGFRADFLYPTKDNSQ